LDADDVATLHKKELNRLKQREEFGRKTAAVQEMERLEMEAKAKAEQDRLHQIIKRQEEEIAQLQQMMQASQTRETKASAQIQQLQLEVSRALSERDTHIVEVQAKQHTIAELKAQIATYEEQVQLKTEEAEKLAEIVERQMTSVAGKDEDLRAALASTLDDLKKSLNHVVQQMTATLTQLTEQAEAEDRRLAAESFPHLDATAAHMAVHPVHDSAFGTSLQMSIDVLQHSQGRFASRQSRLDQALLFHTQMKEASRDFVRQLHSAKLKVSILPDALFLVNKGYTMHSQFNRLTRDNLTQMDKRELLTMLDCLSLNDGVRNFLECEVPLFTDMRQAFDESAEKDLTAPKEILEIEDF
jgi:hypothetical protein